MKAKELISFLEEKYPRNLAEEWDNVGLLVGDGEKEIHKVLFALDVTHRVIEYAVEQKIDMIITHHPLIFRPLKAIRSEDNVGRKIFALVKAGINVYTLHTNLDAQKRGLNDYILEKLGVFNSEILEKREDGTGIGRVFSWKEGKSLKEVEQLLRESLGLFFVRSVICNPEEKISKVCLINGSAMSYWKLAKSKGIHLFITGDVSYHDALDACESGMSVMDIGHLETERFFSELLLRDLQECPLDYDVFQEEPVFQLSAE